MTMCPWPDCSSACELAVVMVAVALVGARRGENVVPLASWMVFGSGLMVLDEMAVAVDEVGPVPEPTVNTSMVFAFEKGIVMTVGVFFMTIGGELVVGSILIADRTGAIDTVDVSFCTGGEGCEGIICTRDNPMGTEMQTRGKH